MAIEQLQHAVDDLASRLRRSVVVDDGSVRAVVTSRHFGDEDEVRVRAVLQREPGDKALAHVLSHGVTRWTTAGFIPALPEIGMAARVCVPIRWRGELLGLLMVMDADGTLTADELSLATAAATDMAPNLDSILKEDASGGEKALWDLVDPRPKTRRQAMSEIAERHDLTKFAPCVALHLATTEVDDGTDGHAPMVLAGALPAEAREDPGTLLYAVKEGSALLLIGPAQAPSRDSLETRAHRLVSRLNDLSAQRFQWVAGIGCIVGGLDLAAETAEQAGLAARAARGPMPRPIVFWEDLGAYASLLRIPPEGLAHSALPSEVGRLLEIDGDGQLTETIRSYLDHGGSSPATADALHIHRTTLYYRLGRVQELAGLDLADGRTRLALHVGLELLRIGEASR